MEEAFERSNEKARDPGEGSSREDESGLTPVWDFSSRLYYLTAGSRDAVL